jgi:hypothetical protein
MRRLHRLSKAHESFKLAIRSALYHASHRINVPRTKPRNPAFLQLSAARLGRVLLFKATTSSSFNHHSLRQAEERKGDN